MKIERTLVVHGGTEQQLRRVQAYLDWLYPQIAEEMDKRVFLLLCGGVVPMPTSYPPAPQQRTRGGIINTEQIT